ncbi:hypothetical protein AB0M22_07995 [Nocardia sp. NPDC051756]|uniref:hypothetical protein n=1 Tax=Nocardia sp. NPDC051756 TaxID=3154751 RepID=UPI0034319494
MMAVANAVAACAIETEGLAGFLGAADSCNVPDANGDTAIGLAIGADQRSIP